MAKVRVEIRIADSNEIVLAETVEAARTADAIQDVLERFKRDPRVADANSWDVKARKVADA